MEVMKMEMQRWMRRRRLLTWRCGHRCVRWQPRAQLRCKTLQATRPERSRCRSRRARRCPPARLRCGRRCALRWLLRLIRWRRLRRAIPRRRGASGVCPHALRRLLLRCCRGRPAAQLGSITVAARPSARRPRPRRWARRRRSRSLPCRSRPRRWQPWPQAARIWTPFSGSWSTALMWIRRSIWRGPHWAPRRGRQRRRSVLRRHRAAATLLRRWRLQGSGWRGGWRRACRWSRRPRRRSARTRAARMTAAAARRASVEEEGASQTRRCSRRLRRGRCRRCGR
jgi:hypothetical protein